MDCYKEMYIKLFGKVCDVIAELQEIQLLTEEMYVISGEDETAVGAETDR